MFVFVLCSLPLLAVIRCVLIAIPDSDLTPRGGTSLLLLKEELQKKLALAHFNKIYTCTCF